MNCFLLLNPKKNVFFFNGSSDVVTVSLKVLIGHVWKKWVTNLDHGPWTKWTKWEMGSGSCLNEVPATGNFKAKTNKEPTLGIKPAKVRMSSRKNTPDCYGCLGIDSPKLTTSWWICVRKILGEHMCRLYTEVFSCCEELEIHPFIFRPAKRCDPTDLTKKTAISLPSAGGIPWAFWEPSGELTVCNWKWPIYRWFTY